MGSTKEKEKKGGRVPATVPPSEAPLYKLQQPMTRRAIKELADVKHTCQAMHGGGRIWGQN